jgi:periplasmic divalent cation tolerance protein
VAQTGEGDAMNEHAAERMALLYCPCPDLQAAKRLGHMLLDRKVAGCINILPEMVSLYDWQGAREEARESVLIAKTSAAAMSEARAALEAEHPYEVPAILVLELAGVNERYRAWLLERIGRSSDTATV